MGVSISGSGLLYIDLRWKWSFLIQSFFLYRDTSLLLYLVTWLDHRHEPLLTLPTTKALSKVPSFLTKSVHRLPHSLALLVVVETRTTTSPPSSLSSGTVGSLRRFLLSGSQTVLQWHHLSRLHHLNTPRRYPLGGNVLPISLLNSQCRLSTTRFTRCLHRRAPLITASSMLPRLLYLSVTSLMPPLLILVIG